MSFLTAAVLMDKYGPLITLDELALILKREKNTVKNQLSTGEVKIKTIPGRPPRFHAEDVAQYIDALRGR